MMDNLPVPPNPTAPKPAGNFIQKHPIWSILIGLFVLGLILQAIDGDETSNASGPSPTMATSTVTETVSPEPTETYSPEPTEAPEPESDTWMKAMALKMALESKDIYTLSSVPNKAIDEAGEATCDTAEQLSPLTDSDYLAMIMAVQNGLDVPKMDAAKITGAFIGVYCPKYLPD